MCLSRFWGFHTVIVEIVVFWAVPPSGFLSGSRMNILPPSKQLKCVVTLILKMEAARSSETSVYTYKSTLYHNQEVQNLNFLKSHYWSTNFCWYHWHLFENLFSIYGIDTFFDIWKQIYAYVYDENFDGWTLIPFNSKFCGPVLIL
jgi:hypothetical protein